ncbi:MAG: ThiF family adenylyltransferase [Bacillota bacterium]
MNPVGPVGCAALVAAEIYRRAESLGPPVDRLSFSFYTGLPSPDGGPRLPDSVDVGRLLQVGLGAVGNAMWYSLGLLPVLRGELAVTDPENADLTNNNRYLLLDWETAEKQLSKVEVVRRWLASHNGLRVKAYGEPFSRWMATEAPVVVAALDSVAGRREVQRALPDVLVNVGTDVQYVSVSVHRRGDILSGDDACLGCLLLDLEEESRREIREATVSFVSCFAGQLAAAEILKRVMGQDDRSFGSSYNVFHLSGSLRSRFAPARRCPVCCGVRLGASQGATH